MTRVPWFIDGIAVDGVLGQPTYSDGGEQTLQVVITDEFDWESTAGIDGGEALWGDDLASEWGDQDLVERADRYTELCKYLRYAGEADHGQVMGGRPHVREHPEDYWPVTSHIVPIEPSETIHYNPGMWALITGGEDDSTIVSEDSVFRLDFDIVMLAKLKDYESRIELLHDHNPILNQQ